MKSKCQELTNILEEQMNIYRHLMDLSVKKQEQLIKGSLDELNEVTKQEEVLIFQLGKLEGKRENCFIQLAELGNFDCKKTLSEVIPLLPVELQEDLEQIEVDFLALLEKLSRTNQENTGLIEQSLDFINYSVDILNQHTKPVYNSEKEIKVEQLNSIFDKKI